MASGLSPVHVLCSAGTTHQRVHKKSRSSDNFNFRSKENGAIGNVVEVMQKDIKFLKLGFSQGLEWANRKFHIPQISKSVEDLIWLRKLEDPLSSSVQFPTFPQPYYPELSGVDLFLADLKALEVYAGYFYYFSKMWTKPLPESFDPQEVTEYFMLRPHLVALRLLEVFTAFASAAIKFRISMISDTSPSQDTDAHGNISNYYFGVVLKDTLLSLGPTFIKVGQSLSTRPDITGFEISKALSELHDQIPPFTRTEAMKIVEEELGSPPDNFFSFVSEEPVAAASFGQVYKARTCDGCDVALKVQRPNLHHLVVRDAFILRIGLGLLQRIAKRKNDLRLYADELGKGLIGELDYKLEAANASKFMEAHSRFPFIVVPRIFQHLSNKRVLTMEWVAGERPIDLMSVSSQESNRKLLDMVNKGVEASLVQLLETGMLHADPHPGNLRYVSSGQIGFLDFGLMCRMEKKHQFAMLASIIHLVNGDWASLVIDLTEMDVIRPGTNIRLFTRDLEVTLGELEFTNGMPDVKFSQVLSKIWAVALKYHCRMPPYFVLVLRSLGSLEGLALAADPTFKTYEAAYPYVVQKLLVDNSPAARKILNSVVFNRKREFRWERLARFIRVGATRKGLNSLMSPSAQISVSHSANFSAPDVNLANLILKILPSKNGLVLRRLLATADGASLVRAGISDEASLFRQQLGKIFADVLYKWMSEAISKGLKLSKFSSLGTNTVKTAEYESLVKDRRLRLIVVKALKSAQKDPKLILRLCWTSFIMFFTASALACHRVVVELSEVYLSRLSFSSKHLEMSV